MRVCVMVLAAWLLSQPAQAQSGIGSCINAGQWASMLLHVKTCQRFELLPEGARLLRDSIGQAYEQGGDRCVSEGRKEMMAHLVGRFPPLEKAIAAGRQSLINETLCDAIWGFLSERRGPPLMAPVR